MEAEGNQRVRPGSGGGERSVSIPLPQNANRAFQVWIMELIGRKYEREKFLTGKDLIDRFLPY
jgi:hypothetical protein